MFSDWEWKFCLEKHLWGSWCMNYTCFHSWFFPPWLAMKLVSDWTLCVILEDVCAIPWHSVENVLDFFIRFSILSLSPHCVHQSLFSSKGHLCSLLWAVPIIAVSHVWAWASFLLKVVRPQRTRKLYICLTLTSHIELWTNLVNFLFPFLFQKCCLALFIKIKLLPIDGLLLTC